MFRNFKRILKSHSQGENQWHSFRKEEMTRHITQRCSQLREICGLEQPGDEPEDNDEPLHDDFIFRRYEAAADRENLLLAANSLMAERKARRAGAPFIIGGGNHRRRFCRMHWSRAASVLCTEDRAGHLIFCAGTVPEAGSRRRNAFSRVIFTERRLYAASKSRALSL